MPHFSAFTPFGSLRFSSRPSHGEKIYKDTVRALGNGANYSDDFGSLAMARVYANSMAFARAKYAVERAGSQFRPSRALELLPVLEAEYGLVPDADATIGERRSELAAAMRISRGARRENVEAIMEELFGDDFVSYVTVDTADAVESTADPSTEGVYVEPGTPRSAFRTLDSVLFLSTPVTIRYEAVAGIETTARAGQRIIIDPANLGRVEAVTVSAVGTSGGSPTLTATFAKPHTAGVTVATGRHPHLVTSKRHNLFVMTAAAAVSERTRRKLNRAAHRLLRGVSTWAITDGSGPFKVDLGKIGITTIGEV